MAESITEGTLKTWSKKVGDSVAADEEVATIETDKVGRSVLHSGCCFRSPVIENRSMFLSTHPTMALSPRSSLVRNPP